jgi:hypothetical protein
MNLGIEFPALVDTIDNEHLKLLRIGPIVTVEPIR